MTFPAPRPAPPPGVLPDGTGVPVSRQVSGYSLVAPPGRSRIPVRHGTDAAIQEIADEVLAGIPVNAPGEHAAPIKDQIMRRLAELAERARPLGGVDLYLPVLPLHGTAVPASFIVSEGRPPAAGIVDSGQVAGYLASAAAGASPVTVDGCAGARLESVAPAETILGIEAASRRVDYLLPVPGQPGQWLIVTFAAAGAGDPEGAFAEFLVELFDSIMLTFRWVADHAPAGGA
jgi:hypothetical protein